MPIPVRDNTSGFKPAPAGAHIGVCVDVVEMNAVKTQYGEKDFIRLVWETEVTNPDNGKPYLVMARFGRNLSSKGRLRPFLESWRGRKFTKEELEGPNGEGFDVEKLIGANAQLSIIHEETDDAVYANISAIMPLSAGMKKIQPSGTYTRVKDREPGADDVHVERSGDFYTMTAAPPPEPDMPF